MGMAALKHRIAGLDGMRAIAVLFVFLDHRLATANAAYMGGYGVQIFFVLSGFLIVGMLHRDQQAIAAGRTTRARAWRSFMIRRAGRILPLYYLLLLACALLVAAGFSIANFSPQEAAIYAAFGTNIYFGAAGSWLGPVKQAWSLAVEEQFYLIAAPVLLAVSARFTRPICLAVACTGCVWHVALLLLHSSILLLRVDSLTNFGFVAMGGVMALRPYRPSAVPGFVLQPALLAGLLLVPLIPHGWENVAVRILIQPLLAALLFAELRDHQQTWLVRLLEARVLTWLGAVSYGFYLLHKYVTPASLNWISGGAVDLTHWTAVEQLAPMFALSLFAASCSWLAIERPLVRIVRARAARGGAIAPPVPAAAIA
jgi:peptidoglycan/LPS O-acetylase OafA/YrhL